MNTTPADLVRILFDDLTTWAAERGGKTHLTQNPFDLIHQMSEPPADGWRLTLHWQGDEPADTRVRSGPVVKNRFRIILSGNIGLTATPKVALFRQTGTRAPFLDLVDAVRQRVMAYKLPWLAEPNNRFYYGGCDDGVPLPDGLVAAAYNISFYLFSTMELPTNTVDLMPEQT